MHILDRFLPLIPARFRTLTKRTSYFFLGTVLTVFYAQLVHAQSPDSHATLRTPYSPETMIAAVIGAIITILFLRGMYLVLTYASETYGFDDDEDDSSESKENNVLLYGAFS